jgi:hypothetical protein
MVKASVERCERRRLGAPSIIAGESLHEYPNAAADRRGIRVFRGSTAPQPRRLLSVSFGEEKIAC